MFLLSRLSSSKVVNPLIRGASVASSTSFLRTYDRQNYSGAKVSFSKLYKPNKPGHTKRLSKTTPIKTFSSRDFTPPLQTSQTYPIIPTRRSLHTHSTIKSIETLQGESREQVLAQVSEKTHSQMPSYDDSIDSPDSIRYADRIAVKKILNEENFLRDGDRVIFFGGANGQVANEATEAAISQGIQLDGVVSIDVREESMQIGRADLENKGIKNVDFRLANAFIERNYHALYPEAKRMVVISLLPPITDEEENRALLHAPQT